MKDSLLLLLFCAVFPNICMAQQNIMANAPQKQHVIIGTGIGSQWLNNQFRYAFLSVEIPVDRYRHIGVLCSRIFENTNYNDFNYNVNLKDGIELGVYMKYFLNGRFTGRKSGFYLGPQVMLGVRNYEVFNYNPSLPNQGEYLPEKLKSSKFMLRWGMQWTFGHHALFDISVPLGFENINSQNNSASGAFYNSPSRTFVILPNITFGLAF